MHIFKEFIITKYSIINFSQWLFQESQGIGFELERTVLLLLPLAAAVPCALTAGYRTL